MARFAPGDGDGGGGGSGDVSPIARRRLGGSDRIAIQLHSLSGDPCARSPTAPIFLLLA